MSRGGAGGKGTRTLYSCTSCGAAFPKWSGQCPDCGAWNCLQEGIAQAKTSSPRFAGYAGGADQDNQNR